MDLRAAGLMLPRVSCCFYVSQFAHIRDKISARMSKLDDRVGVIAQITPRTGCKTPFAGAARSALLLGTAVLFNK